ncbi:diguanylate cyclase domain-containing protein [Peribacillus frigoritolerans]|uniref:diguanylate cyclase domain-containing protein n=1 Tax=Peribacillus frigoritolerans TaxID=450367 RepID=UPI00105A0F77|nr:diguanylate cyclase [Peribacillus frigoritolerans]TDL80717.1 sensor domain-containing diguanylate cyclase [Peribacillus frigoritolerans]
MLLGITSAFIFAVIGWFAAGRIAEPLGSISAAAHSLKKGKNVRIPDYKGIKDIEVLSDSLRDLIADLQKTEDELGRMEDLAYFDGLTGLPNRFSLYLNMEKAMKKAKAGEESFVILFLDLDGFKEINDSFGHHVGDSVLIEIGKRLMNTMAKPSFVSRYGGDEFVCIIPSKNDPEAFGKLYANEMISIINQPIHLAKNEVKVGCSIGCAIWPQDGVNPEDILKLADQALYVSKTSGKNQMSFACKKNA